MTTERKEEIKKEMMRRIHLWLIHSTFDEITCYGSKMRFDITLGLFGGYMFVQPRWMKDKNFTGFITEDEYFSSDYDDILDELFNEEYERNAIAKKINLLKS